MSHSRSSGLVLVSSSYAIWGSLALYWKALERVSAPELLANRIVLSMVLLTVLVARRRSWPMLVALARDRRRGALTVIAALLLSVNWGSYIYGVTQGRVVETALGYFITPLTTVIVGVVVLREHLRPAQWFAVACAATAVTVLTVSYGRPPWLGLVLAITWTGYSYLKRQTQLPAIESLWSEALVVVPVATLVVATKLASGHSAYSRLSLPLVVLLLASSVVTSVPLLLFGAGARRITLVQVGLLQYINPVISFSLGTLVFHESMPAERLVGFVFVWIALAVFTADALQTTRSNRFEAVAVT